MRQVLIQQPVIPSYRVPLFRALSQLEGYRIRVLASERIPGSPDTAIPLEGFDHTLTKCTCICGNRLFWQHGVKLPSDFGTGDILVVNSNPRFLSNAGLIVAALRRGARIIAWNHAVSFSSGRLTTWMRMRLSLMYADLMLLYTPAEVEKLVSEGFAPSRLHAAGNTLYLEPVISACRTWGAPLDSTDPVVSISSLRERCSPQLTEFKRRKGLEDRVLLLVSGRIEPKLKLQTLLHALAHLKERISEPCFQLAVVGTGTAENEMKSLACGLGLDDSVRWLGEIFEESALAPWFLSASLFVFPGAIGLSLVHAMAYGLPVICHGEAELHNPEFAYFIEGKNGRSFQRDDSRALARVIRAMVTQEELSSYSSEALKTAHVDHNFQTMVNNFEEALKRVGSES